jgi:hypothetical protein
MRTAALSLSVLVTAFPARADSCVKPDLIDTFPPNDAKSVPTNATLTAHYNPIAQFIESTGPDSDVVKLAHGSATAEEMPNPEFDAAEGLLSIKPPDGLIAGDDYTVIWPALRGVGTASKGNGATVTFHVGGGPDTEAPTFDGLVDISWDVSREHDECTGNFEDRFAFDVVPGKAHDDFGTDNLQLVVQQSHGGDADKKGAPQQVLISPLPAAGNSVRVSTSIDAAEGHVCFTALVRDLIDNHSDSTSHEVCVHATAPPFFYGCSLSRPAPKERGVPTSLSLVLLSVLSLCARRRHRPAP